MYTTVVNVKKIMDKKASRGLILLFMWPVLVITSLILGVKVSSFFILVMIFLFLSIIPISIYISKLSAPLRGKDAFQNKKVTFHVKDGSLYTDDIILDVFFDSEENRVEISDAGRVRDTHDLRIRFFGYIEEPNIEGFMDFLKEQDYHFM